MVSTQSERVTEKYTALDATRFWFKVAIYGERECWDWMGAKSSGGYGAMNIGPHGAQRSVGAHRMAWELWNGRTVGDGLLILHDCDHTWCVNPSHLHPGTDADNSREMAARGRSGRKLKDACRNGHKYYSDTTWIEPATGTRRCKVCLKEKAQRKRGRAKERGWRPAKSRAANE